MSQENPTATFERLTELGGEPPTLVEGLPGHGLVAAIAVDQINRQLELDHHGNITSREFPPVTSIKDGRVQDLVRVYARDDPPVMTLQSDVALPGTAFEALGQCVLEDLSEEFERAIFLAGAPAESEDQLGDVFGVATTDSMAEQLRSADVEPTEGIGLIGGITGALVSACYYADVPAAVLVVKAHPYLPDPAAARSVIENALEPLLHFDVDTAELSEQAEHIQRQMEQIARHYQQMAQARQPEPEEPNGPTMYQ